MEYLEDRTLLSAGDLDLSFGDGGKVTTDFPGSADDRGRDLVVFQPDGKIVVVGTTRDISFNEDFALARYNSDGSLDTGFHTDGRVTTDFAGSSDLAQGVAIDADGKIVAAGLSWQGTNRFDFALARYNSDGSLDTGFHTDGRVTTDFGGSTDIARGVAIDADGKIVVAGRSWQGGTGFDFALARYEGSPPPTLVINDVSQSEGDGSGTTNFTFTVDRSHKQSAVSVDYEIVFGTATASDFDAMLVTAGTLNFAADDSLSQSIVVPVKRDALVEPHEDFTVVLTNPVGATLEDAEGLGTIFNDDFLGGRVFDDLDNDGQYETADGDAGIAGVTMNLIDQADGTIVADTTTGAGGLYEFAVTLPAGTYTIEEAVDELLDYGLLDGKDSTGTNPDVVDNTQDSNVITGVLIGGTGAASAAVDYLFAEIRPSDTFGMVWRDFNDDGDINFGEHGIDGVTVTLEGTDDRGNSVQRPVQSASGGLYGFVNLRPGTYAITESQPTDFDDGQESLGDVTDLGVASAVADRGLIDGNDRFAGIQLVPGTVADHYNFGERPLSGEEIDSGSTATIGFWHNKNGQELIRLLNGGANDTQLGDWLAATFPDMYGPGATYDADRGPDWDMNLAGKSNEYVAETFMYLFQRNHRNAVAGGPPKVDAQVMATALATYVTSEHLAGGDIAASYGFTTSTDGIAYQTFDVSSVLTAQEAADLGLTLDAEGRMTIIDILIATDTMANQGLLHDSDGDGTIDEDEKRLRTLANKLFTAINEGGAI